MSTAHERSSVEFRQIINCLRKNGSELATESWRLACLMAADADDADISSTDRATFRSVGKGEKPQEAVTDDARLKRTAGQFIDRAERKVLWEEADRLKIPRHRKRLLHVAAETFIKTAERVVDRFTCPRSDDVLHKFFAAYCVWLTTGEGQPLPELIDAGEELDTPEFRDEFLAKLWEDCEAECRDIGLPEPLGRETAADTDAPILSCHAAAIYRLLLNKPPYEGMTGPRILEALAKEYIILDEGALTSRYLPELRPYGLENKKRIGYRIPESRRPLH